MKRVIHIIALGILYSLVLIALNFAREQGALKNAVDQLQANTTETHDLLNNPNPNPPYPPPGE